MEVKNEKKQFYCAIDLGTTNTVFAYGMMDRSGRIKARPLSMRMRDTEGGMSNYQYLMSCVLIEQEKNGGIIPIVGPYAKKMHSVTPYKVVKSVKSKMGTDQLYEIAGQTYTPADISAFILSFALDAAKTLFKEQPDDIVITVPASFDADMRAATLEAAKKAGIRTENEDGSERNILLSEPRAALYNFINAQENGDIPDVQVDITEPKNILVYDLGGGTLDVSLHKVWKDSNHDIQFEDYAISLHTLIGGDNFDECFAQYLYDKISKEAEDKNISDFDKQVLMAKLVFFAEIVKKELSMKYFDNKTFGLEAPIEYELLQTNVYDNINFDLTITADEYLEVVKPLMGFGLSTRDAEQVGSAAFRDNLNIIYPVLDVLAKAREKAGQDVSVDAVLLNGGMTRFFIIQNRLRDFFGIEPISTQDPDLSVALGGVYYHHRLHSGWKQAEILPDSIGIETALGHVEHLAKAGVSLPYQSMVYDKFSPATNGTSILDFPFYVGSRYDTLSPNRKIAERRIRLKKPLYEDDKISIQIRINESGIMFGHAWINDDRNTLYNFEVDSKRETVTGTNTTAAATRPASKMALQWQDSSENPFKPYLLSNMAAISKDYNKTRDIHAKRLFMQKLHTLENSIYECTDKNNVISHIVAMLEENHPVIFYERAAVMLGNLIAYTRKNDDFYRYCHKYLRIDYINYIPEYKSNCIRYMVEAIGKSGSGQFEPILLDMFGVNSPKKRKVILPSTLISLGKTCDSDAALQTVQKHITLDSEPAFLLAALWALGKMGSREKENPLAIEKLEPQLNKLITIAEKYQHNTVVNYAIYAIAEIGDSRFPGHCVTHEKAEDLSRFLQKLSNQLSHLPTSQTHGIINMATNMVNGRLLNESETRYLLEIRSKVS